MNQILRIFSFRLYQYNYNSPMYRRTVDRVVNGSNPAGHKKSVYWGPVLTNFISSSEMRYPPALPARKRKIYNQKPNTCALLITGFVERFCGEGLKIEGGGRELSPSAKDFRKTGMHAILSYFIDSVSMMTIASFAMC